VLRQPNTESMEDYVNTKVMECQRNNNKFIKLQVNDSSNSLLKYKTIPAFACRKGLDEMCMTDASYSCHRETFGF